MNKFLVVECKRYGKGIIKRNQSKSGERLPEESPTADRLFHQFCAWLNEVFHFVQPLVLFPHGESRFASLGHAISSSNYAKLAIYLKLNTQSVPAHMFCLHVTGTIVFV